MPPPRKHGKANCPGELIRAYERPNRSGAVRPRGYVCNSCGLFMDDEGDFSVDSSEELRPAAESMAAELTGLLWDRRVHERAAGIVRSNPPLLSKAQAGNPYINGVRRWWAIASALVLRRHVDPGTPGTLRWILERLAESEEKGLRGSSPSSAPLASKEDLKRLEMISVRFRPYLNAMIHGGQVDTTRLTFNDLHEAIEIVADIGERTYVAITNVSRRFEPVEQFEWTDIFEAPWINGPEEQAYILGNEGVPFDALPMAVSDSQKIARLLLKLEPNGPDEVEVTVTNDSKIEALDVRVFLPYLRTVIDAPALGAGARIIEKVRWVETDDPKFGSGQAVLEFSDVYDNTYRQYADVNCITGTVRRLTRVPFLVEGRIVVPRPYSVSA